MRVNWNLPLVLLKVKTITLFVICLAYAGELSAASFDCSKASNKVERTICSVASISALDEKLAVAYKKAGSSYKQSQRDWLKKRNKCGADANCLFIEYTARIKFLTTASSNPPTPTKRLVKSNLADCSPNVFHNCYGTYTWDTGEKYVGEWQNRMRVGEGIFIYRNGDEYTGSWKGNVPHGKGKLATSVGTIYVGQWIDGKLQENRQESEVQQAEKVRLEAEKEKLLNYVFSQKWELSGLPCDFNGGAYQVFSRQLKVGWNMVAGGNMSKETSNNVRFSFEVLDAKTFRHVMTIYGNDLVTRAIGRPNVRVSYTVDQYTLIDKSTMRRERLNHQEINFDLMLKGIYREERGSEWGKVSTIKVCG